MNISKTELLKTAAKSAYYVMSRSIGFTVLGLLLNIIFLIALLPEMRKLAVDIGAAGGHAGGAAAILVLLIIIVINWRLILLIAAFGILFPILYFVLGKTYGVQKAISSAVSTYKDFLTSYFAERLFDQINRRPEIMEQIRKSGFRAALAENIPKYVRKMDNMPFFVRPIFKSLIRKGNFLETVNLMVEEMAQKSLTQDEVEGTTREIVNTFTNQKFPVPKPVGLWILLGINSALFLALKIFV